MQWIATPINFINLNNKSYAQSEPNLRLHFAPRAPAALAGRPCQEAGDAHQEGGVQRRQAQHQRVQQNAADEEAQPQHPPARAEQVGDPA